MRRRRSISRDRSAEWPSRFASVLEISKTDCMMRGKHDRAMIERVVNRPMCIVSFIFAKIFRRIRVLNNVNPLPSVGNGSTLIAQTSLLSAYSYSLSDSSSSGACGSRGGPLPPSRAGRMSIDAHTLSNARWAKGCVRLGAARKRAVQYDGPL
jgi:hypothetical protein